MASDSGPSGHKWNVEQTTALIKFRAENEDQFSKKKFASKQIWEKAVKDLGLEGKVTGQQASKKWENLKMKYKVLKTPKTGSGTADGECTASNWRYYADMHAVLGGRPSIDPPVLVGSVNPCNEPTTSLTDIGESSREDMSEPRSPTRYTSPPSTPATPATPARQAPTSTPPRKKRRGSDTILEFLKEESVKEQKRHEETEGRTDRFLNLFEKRVDKMPQQ